MALSVLPLGVGNAFTTRSFHTSLVVMVDATRVLVDCPSPLGRMLREAGEGANLPLSCSSLEHVILTHLHADHICGLEEFLYTRRYVENCEDRPHLYTLPENIGPLWDRRLALTFGDTFQAEKAGTTLADLFHIHPITIGQPCAIGGISFEFRLTGHSIPTVGFLASHGGASFGYSGDATYDPELIAFLESADLIFHEGGDGPAHTPFEALAALPSEFRRRLKVVHLPDEALAQPPFGLVAARVGQIYEVVAR